MEEEETGEVVEAVVFNKEEMGGSGTAEVEETSEVTEATMGQEVDEEEVVSTVGRVNVEEVEETGNGKREI